MNPLALGALPEPVAGVKYAETVRVVSLWVDVEAWAGPCVCATAFMAPACNPNKTTKAIADNRDVCFLFIVDFCQKSCRCNKPLYSDCWGPSVRLEIPFGVVTVDVELCQCRGAVPGRYQRQRLLGTGNCLGHDP